MARRTETLEKFACFFSFDAFMMKVSGFEKTMGAQPPQGEIPDFLAPKGALPLPGPAKLHRF